MISLNKIGFKVNVLWQTTDIFVKNANMFIKEESLMGSTGTGKFSDYPGGKGKGKGGAANDDTPNQCDKAIGDIPLEDVARSEFYTTQNQVPPVHTVVKLRRNLVGGRLAIETESGMVIGLLPSRHNYLLACLEQGYLYTGQVISSSQEPIPKINIDLGPEK